MSDAAPARKTSINTDTDTQRRFYSVQPRMCARENQPTGQAASCSFGEVNDSNSSKQQKFPVTLFSMLSTCTLSPPLSWASLRRLTVDCFKICKYKHRHVVARYDLDACMYRAGTLDGRCLSVVVLAVCSSPRPGARSGKHGLMRALGFCDKPPLDNALIVSSPVPTTRTLLQCSRRHVASAANTTS